MGLFDMLRSSDFRTSATVLLVAASLLAVVGLVGTAGLGLERYGSGISLPADIDFLWWLWPLLLVGGLIGLVKSRLLSRRAASLHRIEAGGRSAWGQIRAIKQANWKHGGTTRGQVYYLTILIRHEDGTTHEAVAEDTIPYLPWQIPPAFYMTWLPVLLDPDHRNQAMIQWDQASLPGT